ncbi:MAG: cytochrome C oxidase subunit IV family protein [Myxococcales bacterium]|nr:cytochrome C oxidase subunit IV family protein [Myxococcales bacterium]MCB9715546.1 cytochrome C oxidase subunit IV family protein [Myxococcales bacterium]
MTETKLHLHGKPVEGFVELHEHISPVSTYMKVFGALLVLTALTYAVSYMSLGPASLPVAMIVAVAKASLVCMFFMHLKYDERYHVFIFLSTLIFVGIFFTFTIFDLSSRTKLQEVQGTFFLKDFDREPEAPPPMPVEAHGEGEAAPAEH